MTFKTTKQFCVKTEGFKPAFEEKESINFLDLTVIRKKEKLEIEIYGKPTNSHTPHSTLVCSQPVYCADVYRERRHQMLCEYNLSS
jgi:hypothetical protein